ncbi:MAG: CvpA family protein [Pseudomonadota bacterium]
MEGFTIFDGVVAGVIIISAILAYSRGFMREVLSIAGWIAAAIVAFLFAARAQPLIMEIPYVGDFIGASCEMGIIAAFAVVFVITLIVVSFFTPIFSGAIQRSFIGGLDAGLGFLFGVARGVILVIVGLVAYEWIGGDEPIAVITDSRSVEIFADSQGWLESQVPQDAPGWVLAQYEQLTSTCVTDGDGVEAVTPPANDT